MERVNVEVMANPRQCMLKRGDKGYIHAYIKGADNVPYAVVISGELIDVIGIQMLKVLND